MASYWTPKDYTPFYLMDEPTHTIKEVRAEYSRLRDITRSRADRLEAAGLGNVADYLRQSMPKLRDIKDTNGVTKRLAQGKRNLDTKAYSLKGVKQLQKRYNDETIFKKVSFEIEQGKF